MSSRKLHVALQGTFLPQQTVAAVRGDLARAGDLYRVRFERTAGKELVTYYYNFANHPLRELISTFLFKDAEELTGGTINSKCNSLQVLQEYLTSVDGIDLTPHMFKEYLGWLSGSKNATGGQRFSSTEISGKTLRGNCKRGVQKSADEAISAETYYQLLKAVNLEFEQCKRVQAAFVAGDRPSLYDGSAAGLKRLDPNPYVVLAMMAALRHGIRASELNGFTRGDLRLDMEGDAHELYVHSPDKADDYVPVDAAFVTAWQFCDEWGEEARTLIRGRAQAVEDPLLVYLSTSANYPETLIKLTTDHLNEIMLPFFYRKWFDYMITDAEGREFPLLHAGGDPSCPFWCGYRKLRNSFAVHFADRERSRTMTRRVMRHADIRTTEQHYLQQTRLDHAKKVQIALKTEAQMLVMLIKNRALAGLSRDALKEAEDKGAMLPHGLCGSAMEGEGCMRASDCLECPHLVVLASRKPRFESDREAYLRRAELLNLFWFKTYKVSRPNGEDSATFCFADDIWPLQNLLRPHEVNGAATINFLEVRKWLRDDSKRYMASL
jgi:hypothetical protein